MNSALQTRSYQQLPTPLTSFVGREREVADLFRLLEDPDIRLITLLGPGGVGKTRLALHVVGDISRAEKAQVYFVPLAPITNPAIVISSIGVAIGASGPDDEPTIEQAAEVIGTTDALLVLDNFERLVDAGPVLTELISRCPRLTVLVTSRAVLRLSGEHIVQVKPLNTPTADSAADCVATFPAVQLFRERSDPRRQVSNGVELAAVAEICRRLDGLPLAIELAAARTRTFSARQLLEHLDSGFAVLRHGPRDAPPRLQSMHEMIAWSYDLLTEDEQAMLRLLSVFSGGFTFRAAAEIYCRFREPENKTLEVSTPDWSGGAGDTLVADLLLSLIDQSLVDQTATDDGQPRFTLLETIREFGQERLADSGETDRAFRLHAEWFAALARSRRPNLISMPLHDSDDPLYGEQDNVRAAIEWSIVHREIQLAGWLACGLWPFCYSNGLDSEARNIFDRVLSAPQSLGSALHADLLHNAALNTHRQGDSERTELLASAGLSLFKSLGNQNGIAHCLCLIGLNQQRTAPDKAAGSWAAAVEILREIGETIALVYALEGLGAAFMIAGDLPKAKKATTESAVVLDALDICDESEICLCCFSSLGWIAIVEGDLDLAADILHRMLESWQYPMSLHTVIEKRRLLGRVEFLRGNLRTAPDHYLHALSMSQKYDVSFETAQCLAEMAAVAQADREPELAARWLGFDEQYRQKRRLVLSPDEAILRKTASDHALNALGASRFAAAWEAGTILSTDEACEEALAWHPRKREGVNSANELSRREKQVLSLIAAHRSNREIAEELFLSHRTVESHVTRILAKLDVASRYEAIDVARQRGLLPAGSDSPDAARPA